MQRSHSANQSARMYYILHILSISCSQKTFRRHITTMFTDNTLMQTRLSANQSARMYYILHILSISCSEKDISASHHNHVYLCKDAPRPIRARVCTTSWTSCRYSVAKKTFRLHITTMFTYAKTPLGQSERAYVPHLGHLVDIV